MEVTGKVKVVNPEQQVSASFKKREIVVTTEEQYPQHILIEFTQDKCDLLSNYKQGEAVKVSINLRGREWVNPQGETRYFNSIQGWKIEKTGAGTSNSNRPDSAVDQYHQQHASATPQEAFAPATNINDDEPDDLPF
jgi:single-stranded DNA-binding protein